MAGDSNTWWKSVGNELGRLSNGIDNQVRATNTLEFIRKGEVTRGRTVTYEYFVCDSRPLKSEPFRFKLTLGGEILEYTENESFPEASLLESKILFNSTISDSLRGARFMSCYLKYFSWKLQCQEKSI